MTTTPVVTAAPRPPDDTLDLTGVPCPTNSARALLRLAMLDEGETLALLLDAGEPIENVPPALEAEGHTVIAQEPTATGHRLLVRRG